jgi:hypothetical protein
MTTWRKPELDESAADAVAVLALYITGSPSDAALAAKLLDELTALPDGVARTIGGLTSVCAALLALHEFDNGVAPEEHLRRAALVVRQALPV